MDVTSRSKIAAPAWQAAENFAIRRWQYLSIGFIVFAGCNVLGNRPVLDDQSPIVFSQQPTLEDIVRVVNGNSQRIQQLQTTNATLTVPGLPAMETFYAFQRPHRFRLTGKIPMLGPEIDMGSNDDTYWLWVKRNSPPAIYWGRHDEYSQSMARDVLPVPPQWLVEALGVVEIDPTGQHEGPYRIRPGRLEIRSQVPSPTGMLTKSTTIDDQHGWVLEQHLFDADNRQLASALATGFQYDPNSGISLPRHVQIELPPAQMSFTLQTDNYAINQPVNNPIQLWSMPHIDGYEPVNLADPTRPSRPPQHPVLTQRWPDAHSPVPVWTAIRRLPRVETWRIR